MTWNSFVVTLLVLSLVAASPTTKPTKEKPKKLRDDAPAAVKQAVNRTQTNRADIIKKRSEWLKSRIEVLSDIRSGVVKAGASNVRTVKGRNVYTFPSVEEKQRMVREAQKIADTAKARVEESRTALIVFEQPDPEDVKIGFIGELGQARVRQVVDARNMIVTLLTSTTAPDFSRRGGTASEGSLNRTAFVSEPRIVEIDIWLTNYNTAELSDDMKLEANPNIWINGTRQFKSVSGLRTIPMAEPFDIVKYLAD